MPTQCFTLLYFCFILFFVACSGNEKSGLSENENTTTVQLFGAKVVAKVTNLPTCDSLQEGMLFYVLSDQEFQFCSTKGYQNIDLSGTDGIDGINGEDGSSCSVSEARNGQKSIRCQDGTTAKVNDGVSCTVADNGDGSYDLGCSGTTVTIRDGVDGEPCLADKRNDSLFVDCGGVLDTIVDGTNGANGSSCSVSDDGAGTLTQACTDGSRVSWPKALCGAQPYEPSKRFCDARDDQLYRFVSIGLQVWMAENLTYGNPISYYCDGSSPTYCDSYGGLYSFSDATTACPTGWHLPSDEEWQTLEIFLGMDIATAQTSGWRGDHQGEQLKANSLLWKTNSGTDSYGFSALPGGSFMKGSFYKVGEAGTWWTSTPSNDPVLCLWFRELDYNQSSIYRGESMGLWRSIRCVKND